jgi:hypothetical protein
MSDDDARVAQIEASLSEEDKVLLDRLIDGIVSRRLTPVVLFFLESMKPLAFVGSQVMYFFQPIVQALWHEAFVYERLAKILEKRGSVEMILRRLEKRV